MGYGLGVVAVHANEKGPVMRTKHVGGWMRMGMLVLCVAGAMRPGVVGAAEVKEVVIVSKTHFDIGYTARVAAVLDRYRTTMMDGALSVMDETASLPKAFQFAWMLPGWPLTQIVGPEQTPDRREKVLEAMRSGRIVWHALPFTMHTESLDLEDLVRGLGCSSALSRGMGMALPTDAKMTDVPSHAWVLPTLLARAGVKSLHLGCNAACRSPQVPRLFWWEGPDGSRVLTFYSADAYGTGLVPPEDWPFKTWLAMLMTNDNQGPPTLQEARTLQDQAAKELPGVNVHFGKLSDFAEAILSERPELPVVRGDMPDTWIHGLESMPAETGMARRMRPQIGAVEQLDTVLRCWGVATEPVNETVAKAYENSLLYGEHTWGSNGTKPGPFRFGEDWKKARAGGVYTEFEASFADHRAYAENVEKTVAPALRQRLDALARATAVDGARLVVYNPLPWQRDAVAEWEQEGFDAASVRDVSRGRVEPVAHAGRRHRFVAHDVPAMGYATYVPVPGVAAKGEGTALVADAASGVLDNGVLRVTVDAARGGVRSVVEKSTGRELVDGASPLLLGQYLYERFGREETRGYGREYIKRPEFQWAWDDLTKVNQPEGDHASASPAGCGVVFAADEAGVCATLSGDPQGILKDRVELKVQLYRGLPFVEIAWSIENKTGDPWPEAGWICLPLKAERPRFHLGRTGAIIDPATDIIAGSNRHVLCLNSGMTVTGAGGGCVGVCPLDSPLVSLGRPGLWQYSLAYTADRADVFVNVFNNMWSTNFPLWVEGIFSSRVRIWAAKGDDAEALLTPSWEGRSPCMVGVADGAAGSLAPSQSGMAVGRAGVLVTALGDNPDGAGRLLRVWEQAGIAGDCTVTMPSGFDTGGARYVDLRGQTLEGTVPVNGRDVVLPLQAYAPCSVVFGE